MRKWLGRLRNAMRPGRLDRDLERELRFHISERIEELQKQAAENQSAYAGEQLRESEEDILKGSALKIAAIQARATVLESQQAILTAELQLSDLTTELNDLLALPLDTRLELDPAVPASLDQRTRAEYVQAAWAHHPEILAAEEAIRKARAGVTAAKTAYIPDITAYARAIAIRLECRSW
jgi:outer membrane protein TolC